MKYILKLAGVRVNPQTNYYHGRHGGVQPRLMSVKGKSTTELNIPNGAEVLRTYWAADGERFAMSVIVADGVELWMGDVSGKVEKVQNVKLNPLMDSAVKWFPDQQRLLVRAIPDRGEAPVKPMMPIGPKILEDAGAKARSTYEAPDGKYLLVERLKAPWSHEVAYWRFANDIEVWDMKGKLVKTIHNHPVADNVLNRGVITGPRSVQWQATAPHSLFWTEALDGGDPLAEVDFRDKLVRWEAPFDGQQEEIYKAKHRIRSANWAEADEMLMVTERERIKRWRYTYLVDVNKGTSKLWFDLDESDRYNDPGSPLYTRLENGRRAIKVQDGNMYFRGRGGSEAGDRPFVDKRNLESGAVERIFRCEEGKYEYFVDFAGDTNSFIMSSESNDVVPNFYLATLGKSLEAVKGEGTRALSKQPITAFKDPSPELRKIKSEIVKYKRDDGVELSFTLMLPPGYQEGTTVPDDR